MKKGTILSIISGVIVIFATFLMTWFTVAGENAYGIGLIKNISSYFSDAETIATSWGVPTFAIYIVGACYLLFLASGVLILVGAKSRAAVIVGSIMPIGLCLAILFGSLDIPAEVIQYVGVFLDADWLVPGILPLTLEVGPTGVISLATVALGTYVLLAGGVLGIVSAFLERD